jgi:ribonuclease Z
VAWHEQESSGERLLTLGELRPALQIVPGQILAYVTDVAWQPGNVARIGELASRADILYIEAAFMQRDEDHALKKHHLTATQAGLIARDAEARAVVPMHVSPRYAGNELSGLREEVAAAYGGTVL